ncbi:MAG: hypothetical protein PW788_03985 [Micavibrio sp.]|nr:hypothetical protein [Micavibrio sp.]
MTQADKDAAVIATLDKPGAGLPLGQQLLLRLYVKPFLAAKPGWEADVASLRKLNDKILDAVAGIPASDLSRRVLVPPQMGLENSSRYWSAAMTLEHMVIVGTGVRNIIVALGNGTVPNIKPDTASVKPAGNGTPADALASFTTFADSVMADIDAKVTNRDSTAKLDHPWFGAFTARQWHWILPMHAVIHLKQLRAIAKGIKESA